MANDGKRCAAGREIAESPDQEAGRDETTTPDETSCFVFFVFASFSLAGDEAEMTCIHRGSFVGLESSSGVWLVWSGAWRLRTSPGFGAELTCTLAQSLAIELTNWLLATRGRSGLSLVRSGAAVGDLKLLDVR